MAQEFDFVVVGGGTAGCLLASRLADLPSRPNVALLEGGGDINRPELRLTAERFEAVAKPGMDYGYVSTPQAHAGGREVAQARGKGLGGSSAANFQVWSLGAREEFDTWAERVGDDAWGFDSVLARIKQLENLHIEGLTQEWDEYIKPDPKNHGFSGPIDVSIGHVEAETKAFFDAGLELGHKRNLDPNGGDPIGFSLSPATSYNGYRTTAASAFLEKNPRANLTVVTDSRVVKILFEQDRAIGVLTEDGTRVTAKKEVIVSAGALDTPRLLLLSGVGPRADLEAVGIPVVKDLDGVGKSFTDHAATIICFEMKPGFTDRRQLVDPEKFQKAAEELAESGKGPLLGLYSSVPHAFLKNRRALASSEFQLLPAAAQEYLLKDRVPNFELVTMPLMPPDHVMDKPDDGFFTVGVACMNSQSQGQIKVGSADPKGAPLINPNYLSVPFDLVNLREGVREGLRLLQTATMKNYYVKTILAPKSDSDEDIDEFIRRTVAGLWHPSCSMKMGKAEDDGSCVDKNLKVHGLKGLRVADLSVTPLLPSGHPQIVAYVIGQIASEKIAREYEQRAGSA